MRATPENKSPVNHNALHQNRKSYVIPQTSSQTVLPPTREQPEAIPRTTQEAILFKAVQSRHYGRVIRMFEEMSSLEQRTDQRHPIKAHMSTPIINVYLDALSHLGRIRDLEEAVSQFRSFPNQSLNKETYALLLRTYIQSMNLRKARLLLCEMMSAGIRMDQYIIKIILRGEGRWATSLNSIDSLLDLLTSESLDMAIYNIIISTYLRRGRSDKARIVIDKIVKMGLRPDTETFYALMQYQAAKEGSRGVSAIFNSMEKLGVAVQHKHLNLLISALARESQIDLTVASTIFSEHHLNADIATCNIVLRAVLGRKFDSQQIDAHFQEMRRLAISPDAYTYTILLNEYKHKRGPWQRTQKVLQSQLNLKPSRVNQVTRDLLLHRMIATFQRSADGQTLSAEQHPLDLSLRWDLHTLTTLVTAYSRSRDWETIASLNRELLKRQVKLDRYFYRVMIKALLDGEQYKEADEVTFMLFNSDDILDQIFGRECQVRIAHTFFRNSRKGRDRVIQTVDHLLKFSDEQGIIISEKLCNLIAIAFLDIGLERLAIQLLESRYQEVGRFQDLEQGQKLGMSSWVVLMRAYSRFNAKGIKDLRSCVERALTDESKPPTRTFLRFLRKIGSNPKLRSTHATDCDFFLHARLKCLSTSNKAPTQNRRMYLTKTNILRWVNNSESGAN